MPWPRWANRLTRRCPNVIMQDQNAGAAVRTWSQHAGMMLLLMDRGVRQKLRGRVMQVGRVVCQAGPPACMQQQLVASRTLVFVIHAGRRPSSSHLFPSPTFPGCGDAGRGEEQTQQSNTGLVYEPMGPSCWTATVCLGLM